MYFLYCFYLTFLEHYRVALAIPNTKDGRSKCTMYAVDFTNILQKNETINKENWPEKPCSHGWEYNRTELPYATITTDVGLNIIGIWDINEYINVFS